MLINKLNTEAAKFVSTDQSRPALNAVHITEKYIEATDGHIIVRIDLPKASESDFPTIPGFEPSKNSLAGTLVESGAFARLGKRIPSRKSKELEALPILKNARLAMNGDNSVKAGTTDLECPIVSELPIIEGPYPNTDKIVFEDNGDPVIAIAFNASNLRDVCDLCLKAANPRTHQVIFKFYSPFQGAEFSTHNPDTDQNVRGIIMPLRIAE